MSTNTAQRGASSQSPAGPADVQTPPAFLPGDGESQPPPVRQETAAACRTVRHWGSLGLGLSPPRPHKSRGRGGEEEEGASRVGHQRLLDRCTQAVSGAKGRGALRHD